MVDRMIPERRRAMQRHALSSKGSFSQKRDKSATQMVPDDFAVRANGT